MHLTIDCSAHLQIIPVFMKWSWDVCILSANEATLSFSELLSGCDQHKLEFSGTRQDF